MVTEGQTGVRLLVGSMRAGQAWCYAHEVNPRSRYILFGVTAMEVCRHLRGRNPRDVTITLGNGAPNVMSDEARATIAQFRAQGAQFNVWTG